MANYLTGQKLNDLSSVKHGFFTCEGGVSKGVYSSLNCGTHSLDEADNIIKNRVIALNSLANNATLVEIHQTHTPLVHVFDGDLDVVNVDAIVTDRKNIALSVVTADCAPVLLCDPTAGVIGAAHAGWKGAYYGIIKNTVEAMIKLGATAENMTAAIGPCITQNSYEVGQEFYDKISNESYFKKSSRENHHLFDLEGYVFDRLWQCNVTKIDALNVDTYDEKNNLFSYRRKTHLDENDFGRQISIILQQ